MKWIYDLVDEALYYEIYQNPDNREGEYDYVTDRMFRDTVENITEFLINSDELPMSNPDWRDEENAHLMVLDYLGSYGVE